MAKQPTTTDAQVALLVARGLQLGAGEQRLRLALENMGYYRLSGYWRYHQVAPGDGHNDFLPGTTVDHILDPVEFDGILRSVLMDGLAVVEIALKSQLANRWAMETSSVGWLDASEFDTTQLDSRGRPYATATLERINEAIADSREEYIAHHRDRGEAPPIWAGMGVLPLGTVSKLYRVCAHPAVKQHVAHALGLKDINLATSALEGLTVLRNICAHHLRLWNRTGLVAVQLPKAWKNPGDNAYFHRTPWALLVLVRGVVEATGVAPSFAGQLTQVLHDYNDLLPGLKRPYSTKCTTATAYSTHS